MYKIILFFGLALPFAVNAQDSTRMRSNTIKINLVSSFLYSSSAALSYERVVKPNQSWAIMAGYLQFPNLGNLGSSFATQQIKSNTGYVIGGEYRFYLKKENKYTAPHGVYIGPYLNFFRFNNERTMSYTSSSGVTSQATLNSKFGVLNVGVQLGYQFVVKDRWTFDFIFIGPSLSNYNANISLDGNLDAAGENELRDKVVAALMDRFPLIKDLVGNEDVTVHGTSSKWAGGFRYQMNIGYRFGRSKKH